MDEMDSRIIAALRQDARMPLSDLATVLNISRTTLRARMARLQERGEIVGFTVLTRADVMRDPVRGLMMIGIEGRGTERITRQLSNFAEVRAVHSTNGRWDVIVEIGTDTLEALEAAAYDGRLATIKGIGPRRIESLRHSLTDMLARRRPRHAPIDRQQPSVADILAVDQAYRSNLDRLPTIKPRRFNPTGDSRLPILHTEQNDWQFTALFSNTPNAQRFGKICSLLLLHQI